MRDISVTLTAPLKGKSPHFNARPCFGRSPFKLTAPAGGGAAGEIVRFEEKNGKVTRMMMGATWANSGNGH